MKSNIITLGLLLPFLALCIPGFAQDTLAIKILNTSKTEFEKLEDFITDFEYILENPLNTETNVSESGKLYYSNGKYAVMLSSQEIYCDGKTIWIHLPEEKEVNIMDYDEEEGLNIQEIFSFYEEGSKARYDGTVTIEGRSMHKIYIAYTSNELEFNQARIWINRSSNLVEKVVLTNRRQINTIYQFSNIKTNQNLPLTTFIFNTDDFDGDIYDDR